MFAIIIYGRLMHFSVPVLFPKCHNYSHSQSNFAHTYYEEVAIKYTSSVDFSLDIKLFTWNQVKLDQTKSKDMHNTYTEQR